LFNTGTGLKYGEFFAELCEGLVVLPGDSSAIGDAPADQVPRDGVAASSPAGGT
jgi:hypothetical protein